MKTKNDKTKTRKENNESKQNERTRQLSENKDDQRETRVGTGTEHGKEDEPATHRTHTGRKRGLAILGEDDSRRATKVRRKGDETERCKLKDLHRKATD